MKEKNGIGPALTLVAVSLALLPGGAVASDEHNTSTPNASTISLSAENTAAILDSMGISGFETQDLEIDDNLPGFLFTTLEVAGESWTIGVEKHSLRSDDFELWVQLEDGTLEVQEAPPVATYRGTVEGIENSVVAAGYSNGLFRAVVITPDRTIGIQPLSDAVTGLAEGGYIVYDAADNLPLADGFCATDLTDHVQTWGGGSPRGIITEVADLGIDTDFEFFQDNGSNVSDTVQDIELVVNTFETIYEAVDIGITYEITTLIVRTSSSDPYTSSDAGTLLDQFTDHWNASPQSFIRRDVAHLFSGRSFNGSTIGIAWLGVICNVSSLGYGTVESNFSSNLTTRAGLSAHEIGHNWDANHCDGEPDCKIMCSVLGGCTGILTDFGESEVDEIVAFKNTRGCLTDVQAPLSPPFTDTFPTTTIDTTLWTYNFGGLSNTDATNEPSSPNSLNLDAGGSEEFRDDEIRTNFIQLSGQTNISVSFSSQHKGVESGESLMVEYYSVAREWLSLLTITSDGVDQTAFTAHSILVPALGLHNEFRVRFRTAVTETNDDWYVDSVTIGVDDSIDVIPPSPNPMTFAAQPLPTSTTSVFMVATTAVDTDSPPVEYEFDVTSITAGGSDSGWQASTSYTDSELIANSPYTYRVRARDSAPALNTTEFSAESATASAIETPGAPLLFGATNNSITILTTTTYSNLLAGSSGIFFDSTTAGGDGGLNVWTQSTLTTATGLSPDTLYAFQVKARNQLAIETVFGPSASEATLANVPGAPVLANQDCDSMTVDVVTGGNPGITTYAIQCTVTTPNDPTWNGKFVAAGGTASNTAVFQTDATWGVKTILDLNEATTYTFVVTAKNQKGVVTANSPGSSKITDTCSPSDSDGDGVPDASDDCPGTPVGESVDANGCSASQLDDDNDGVSNADDDCPGTSDGSPVDGNGCACEQLDADNDGVDNCTDLCASTPEGETPDTNGCSASQLDDDNDGVSNADDDCPGTADGSPVDGNGCACEQLDADNDGVDNCTDVCADTPTGETPDADGCGPSQLDGDGDGVSDADDLCPGTAPGTPVDADGCPLPSGCDGDANGDGTVDPLDAGYVSARFGCPVGSGDAACDAADVNLDTVVDPLDVGYVLARFGGCPQ